MTTTSRTAEGPTITTTDGTREVPVPAETTDGTRALPDLPTPQQREPIAHPRGPQPQPLPR